MSHPVYTEPDRIGMTVTPLPTALTVNHACSCGATFSIELALHTPALLEKVLDSEAAWRGVHSECQIREDSALVQSFLSDQDEGYEGGPSPEDFGDPEAPFEYRLDPQRLNGLIKEASQQQNPRWSDADPIPADDPDA